LGAGGDDLISLLAVPVASVGEHRRRSLVHTSTLQLADRGVKHRGELTEVR
jgi:hypothetical protein